MHHKKLDFYALSASIFSSHLKLHGLDRFYIDFRVLVLFWSQSYTRDKLRVFLQEEVPYSSHKYKLKVHPTFQAHRICDFQIPIALFSQTMLFRIAPDSFHPTTLECQRIGLCFCVLVYIFNYFQIKFFQIISAINNLQQKVIWNFQTGLDGRVSFSIYIYSYFPIFFLNMFQNFFA